jgi:hypothetical protein
VARLALANPGVPVLPIGQWGAQRTLARGGRFRPFPRQRHEASVGRPVDLEAFRDVPQTAELLDAVTAHVMAAITAEVAQLRGEPVPARR